MITSNQNQVSLNDKIYTLDLAFPLVFMCFDILKDNILDQEERLDTALFCFVSKEDLSDLSLQDKSKLLDKIFNKYIYTKEDKRRSELLSGEPKSFNFNQDWGLIYSSVLQQYGVDLTDEHVRQTLTWKKLNALIDGLSDDTSFRKVTMYRTVKIDDKKMSDEQQEFYRKMKTVYALKPDKNSTGKLTNQEVAIILKPLDMIHKTMKLKELRDQGRI